METPPPTFEEDPAGWIPTSSIVRECPRKLGVIGVAFPGATPLESSLGKSGVEEGRNTGKHTQDTMIHFVIQGLHVA